MNTVKTISLGNNLLTHIRENTDFLRQKPQLLPSAKANVEGWYVYTVYIFLYSSHIYIFSIIVIVLCSSFFSENKC